MTEEWEARLRMREHSCYFKSIFTTEHLEMNDKEVQRKSATLFIGVRKKIKNDQTNHISSQKNVLDDVF